MTHPASAASPAPVPDLVHGHQVLSGVRLDALFEAVPLAIATFDGELRLVDANTRYRELTGIDLKLLARVSIYDAFPNALADLTEQIDAALRGARTATARIPFQHRDGRRLIETTFAALPDSAGSRGLLFTGNEVSEREELRQTLGRSVAQLESIFDVIPDSVRVFDVEGRIVRSNTQAVQDHASGEPPTLRELWQLDRPRTVDGTSLFMHEHPTARALRGERVRGETLVVRRGADGAAVIVEVSSNPLYDETGRVRGAVTVDRDVTVKTQLAKALEEEARRTAELYELVSTEAERLDRMVQERTAEVLALQEARARERRLAAIGQLAAGVMHDVNNALNPIMAAAYLLNANAENPTAVRDYADRIAKAAETGAATAARVGRFIRQEPLQGERDEEVDLSVVCDEVVALTRPLWAERARGGTVHLERDLPPGALVSGIAGELREALLNLVQNALDAMEGGGTLGLRTFVSDHDVRLEVRDSGIGMTAEVRERAFEPFFTTKGRAGTGLGLAEVYGIVKRHRGRAEIESMPGAGTTIRLVFPHYARDERAQSGDETPASPARRVLLVEDQQDSRDFMRAVLQSDGHWVDAVGGVEEALQLLESASLAYDVLVTDLGLADRSGWELVTTVRERWPSMRVGVVTGWEPGAGAGADGDFVLRKPVRTSELLAHVAELS
ncbi:MAG TPA: ATP-binding protein [Gemmatimonadaceae bacterium]|jgi:PAS domain S-box-containing protein|nr:ATP-binding protein [Gemmatimonadaceae bacterium]